MILKKLIVGTVLGAAAVSSSWASTNLLINSFLAPKDPINTEVLVPWTKEVYKATEGRVRISIAPQSLAAPSAQMDAVVNGVVDGAYMYHGFLASSVKLTQVAQLPFMTDSAKGAAVALWRTYKKYFENVNEYGQVHVLSFFGFPGTPLFAMKNPIKSVADLKGIRIFANPGASAKIANAAGAGVIADAAARSHEIISNGTVDAFSGHPIFGAFNFHTDNYVRSVTEIPGGLTGSTFAFFVNKAKWNSLEERDREIITKLSGEAFAERSAAFDKVESEAKETMIRNGVKFVQASPQFVAGLHALGDPMVQKWLSDAAALGVDGKAALAYYKAQQDLVNSK